jgi:hypothetical protein
MARALRVLSESEASPESFHDCHVHGLHWRRDSFTFSMNLQYILEWVAPSDGSSGYRFSISEGELTFHDVDELKVSMDWSDAALDAEIAAVRISTTRTTPNGRLQRYFEIEFADPDAIISLWSTGYEVRLLHEPVISAVTSIPFSEGSS